MLLVGYGVGMGLVLNHGYWYEGDCEVMLFLHAMECFAVEHSYYTRSTFNCLTHNHHPTHTLPLIHYPSYITPLIPMSQSDD